MVSCLLYAMMSAFFLAVFLVKYRIEYLLATPIIAALFGQYFALSLKHDSVAQRPEKLFREKRLIVTVAATVIILVFLTFVQIPAMRATVIATFHRTVAGQPLSFIVASLSSIEIRLGLIKLACSEIHPIARQAARWSVSGFCRRTSGKRNYRPGIGFGFRAPGSSHQRRRNEDRRTCASSPYDARSH